MLKSPSVITGIVGSRHKFVSGRERMIIRFATNNRKKTKKKIFDKILFFARFLIIPLLLVANSRSLSQRANQKFGANPLFIRSLSAT